MLVDLLLNLNVVLTPSEDDFRGVEDSHHELVFRGFSDVPEIIVRTQRCISFYDLSHGLLDVVDPALYVGLLPESQRKMLHHVRDGCNERWVFVCSSTESVLLSGAEFRKPIDYLVRPIFAFEQQLSI